MTIKIKTTLITLEIEDNHVIGSDNFTKRSLPELPICIYTAINEAIRLHNEVKK